MSGPIGRMALLIEATEETFNLEKGDILKEDRSQPLASIRQLAMVVARERGFGPAQVARAFKRDRNSVWNAVQKVNHNYKRNYAWWHTAKADLIDAWDDKLYPQKAPKHANDGKWDFNPKG